MVLPLHCVRATVVYVSGGLICNRGKYYFGGILWEKKPVGILRPGRGSNLGRKDMSCEVGRSAVRWQIEVPRSSSLFTRTMTLESRVRKSLVRPVCRLSTFISLSQFTQTTRAEGALVYHTFLVPLSPLLSPFSPPYAAGSTRALSHTEVTWPSQWMAVVQRLHPTTAIGADDAVIP